MSSNALTSSFSEFRRWRYSRGESRKSGSDLGLPPRVDVRAQPFAAATELARGRKIAALLPVPDRMNADPEKISNTLGVDVIHRVYFPLVSQASDSVNRSVVHHGPPPEAVTTCRD